jgi:hypothetical protein
MRAVRFLAAACAAACACAVLTDARAAAVQKKYRLVRLGDDGTKQHPPGPYLTAPSTCTPDLPAEALAQLPPERRLLPEILGPLFDPADFDEISVAGDGKLLALATSVSEQGVPGLTKQILILGEGPGAVPVRVPLAGVSDDQPAVQLDEFGYRCVFRSAPSPGGSPSNIQLYSFTDDPLPEVTGTVAVTEGTSETSFDPAFTARIRVRDLGGGLKKRERDARVVFVSTDDLVEGENPDNLEQLFQWREQGATFVQLTHHTNPDAHLNRPSISKSGDIVDFECTADLVPGAVDPLDASRVGNPDHVRQIFRWRRGRGIQQLTWSDGDCFSPRTDPNGRFVLFASRGDPITGGNPEKNLEIFQWVASAKPHLRLRQLTQAKEGDSVFPRPTLNPKVFTFFSTCIPPQPAEGSNPAVKFGDRHECTPQALLYDHGKIVHIHGLLDIENAVRVIQDPTAIPVLTGPPAPGIHPLKIYFATNDPKLNPRPAPGEDPDTTASIFAFHVAMATRYAK